MHDKDVVFSVVILTYNQLAYLEQTINSILDQNHDYRYEIVIGDDCSTDGTRELIKEYKKKYPNIIIPVFNNTNLGVVHNFYNAISYCKGEYIMECGGDDYWLPNKVKKQIQFMNYNPSVGMTCGYAQVYNQELEKVEKKRMGSPAVKYEELLINNEIAAVTVCYRRKLLLQYMERIKPQMKNWMAEDYPIWLWFAQNSDIQFMRCDLAVYRLLSGSISHPKSLEKRLVFEKNMYQISKYYSDKASIAKIRNRYLMQIAYICYCYGDLLKYNTIIDHWSEKDTPIKYKIVYVINKIPFLNVVIWRLFRRRVGTV